jgi:hypothetical protein
LSSDLVLLDELREHRDYEVWGGAITKTTMARPAPQIIGFSNAGDSGSVVLSDLRAKALAAVGEPSASLGLFEWSAPDECAGDDADAWAAMDAAISAGSSATMVIPPVMRWQQLDGQLRVKPGSVS